MNRMEKYTLVSSCTLKYLTMSVYFSSYSILTARPPVHLTMIMNLLVELELTIQNGPRPLTLIGSLLLR